MKPFAGAATSFDRSPEIGPESTGRTGGTEPRPHARVRLSLTTRLTLWYSLVAVLLVLLLFLIVRFGVEAAALADLRRQILADAREIKLLASETATTWDSLILEIKLREETHGGWYARIVDRNGIVLFQSEAFPDIVPVVVDPPSQTRIESEKRIRWLEMTLPASPRGPVVFTMARSIRYIEEDLARITWSLISAAVPMLVLAPIGGFALSRRATRPFAALLMAADRLAPERLDDRLPIAGARDELDRLATTINGLLDRIAANIRRNRQFVADAAHELRSPIAALQTSVELSLQQDRSPEDYREHLANVAEECASLRRLVNQLLLLAEGDTGVSPAGFEAIRLADKIRKVLDMFAGVAEAGEVGLRLELGPGAAEARVAGERTQLRQVLNNLIDNAIKFTPADGEVTVRLAQDSTLADVVLEVNDTGAGIPPEDQGRLFERFFQRDRARSRGTRRGSGLGLSICRSLVELHGGTIEVESEVGRGTTFRVRLPPLDSERGQRLLAQSRQAAE